MQCCTVHVNGWLLNPVQKDLTKCAKAVRVSAIAVGALMFLVGVLCLSGAAFEGMGVTAGRSFVALGPMVSFAGLIKCLKPKFKLS